MHIVNDAILLAAFGPPPPVSCLDEGGTMSELSTWDVLSQAVWREQVGDQTISLRHPTYPAEADWTDNNPDTLTKIVAEYVSKVSGVLGLPPLFNDGSSDFKEHMAWLPYAGGKILDPRRSFD